MQQNKQVAVLIPCYNESLTIEKVVKDWRKALPEADIYVYDNNSTDGTAEIAKNAGAIVRYEYQQGKGNVVRRMFREIDADCYIMIDGDDTYPAKHGREMVDLILNKKADMVVGDRLSTTYFQENKRPFHNFGNNLVRTLINIFFCSDIKDVMTGCRAFSYEFVKTFPVTSKGFEIETEMTVHAIHKNLKIDNVDVDYKDRPKGSESKLQTIPDGIRIIKTLLKMFKNYRPIAFFSVLTAIVAFMALGFLTPTFIECFTTGTFNWTIWTLLGGFFSVSSLQLLMTGIVLNTIASKERRDFELSLQEVSARRGKRDD